MLKALGLFGIVISCGLTGIAGRQRLIKRKQLLEDFLQMILSLKGKINYFREPLTEVLAETDEKRDSEAFRLIAGLGDEIGEKGREIGEIWLERADEIYKGAPLTAEDMEAVRYPGRFIGQTDFENHVFHFEYLEEKLRGRLREAEEAVRVKGPLYGKVGFMAGAVIAIVLM